MTVLEQLRAALPELSKSERKVAEHLLHYPYDASRFTADAIANVCGTSRSAVIRLCKKLGYSGYSELRYALMSQENARLDAGSGQPCALERYAECIQQMKVAIPAAKIEEIAELILRASRVVTLGHFHSALSAQQMAFRLNRLHIDSHAVSDTSIMDAYGSILKQGDVVLIFSISGNEVYHNFVETCRKNRVVVVLFTMSPQSPLARSLKYTVTLPFVSHLAGDYLMDDAITFFLAIEMVIEAIHKKLGEA